MPWKQGVPNTELAGDHKAAVAAQEKQDQSLRTQSIHQSERRHSGHGELPPYVYQPLDELKNEIRLVTIRPGNHDDPIDITMAHVSLNPLVPQTLPKLMSLEEVRRTLPPAWEAHETIHSRFLFWTPGGSPTWVHPNPQINQAAYDSSMHPVPSNADTPDFEALSYAWGPLNLTASVVVCTDLDKSTAPPLTTFVNPKRSLLRVGSNLFEALQYLRLLDEPRVMWIDALCINQNDFEERGQQVARMAHIYSRARKVVAWIGPEHDDATRALEGLAYIGSQVEHTTDKRIAPSPEATEPDWWHPETTLPFDDAFWGLVTKLVERPWFWRLWVIQEIHMGNTRSCLKCGTQEISWSMFQRGIRCLDTKYPCPISNSIMTRLQAMSRPGTEFLKRLSRVGPLYRYSDPRDIIYGLLSFASPELLEALHVDYSSDIQTVYKQFFTTYNNLESRSDLLLFPCNNLKTPEGRSQLWPSWLPDWRGRILWTGYSLHAVTSAAGLSCGEVKLGSDSNDRLFVQGVILNDAISSQLSDNLEDLTKVVKILTNIADHGISEEAAEHGNCTSRVDIIDYYIEAVHQGLTRNQTYAFKDVPSPKQFREDVLQRPNFLMTSEESLPSWWGTYRVFIGNIWTGTRLFVTHEGFPVVCDCDVQPGRSNIWSVDNNVANVKPGDSIFIPLGCRSPIAIRRVANEDTFRMVGSVYVSGIMNGEVLLGQLPDPWRVLHDPDYEDGKEGIFYQNPETGEVVTTDPRLDQVTLPSEWEAVAWVRRDIDPAICCRFKNKVTGELINYDPRMTSKALRERGVAVQEIILI
ncbi:Inosine/uridine-preferring nucleoside hydrolase [Apiospora arundinis]